MTTSNSDHDTARELLDDTMALLRKIKNTGSLWDGRTGLTCTMREDVNDLNKRYRTLVRAEGGQP